jgi:hypothetical protein
MYKNYEFVRDNFSENWDEYYSEFYDNEDKQEFEEDFENFSDWILEVETRLNCLVENGNLTVKEFEHLFLNVMNELVLEMFEYCLGYYTTDEVMDKFCIGFDNYFMEEFEELVDYDFNRKNYDKYVNLLENLLQEYREFTEED